MMKIVVYEYCFLKELHHLDFLLDKKNFLMIIFVSHNFWFFRNRLESNAEHWNALLLSLRELIEWVIRKDTELTGLGPIGGDLASLHKQQDDHRAFRRQLEEKRPVVESNLLSGRQYIANEPPLSDTSDSEGL